MENFISRAGTLTVDADTDGLLEAANDTSVIDTRDLTKIEIGITQTLDGGTQTIVVEKSFDGVNWFQLGAILTEASFAVGNGTGVIVSLSDANGMPLHARQVRVRITAATAGGAFKVTANGLQRPGHGG